MNYLNTEKDNVLMGSGYLYAMAAADFDPTDIDVSDMTEIGYIKESATFKRTHTGTEINSANYGLVEVIANKYQTTFETGIISYNAQNVAQFMTGSSVVNVGETTKRTYFAEGDKIPAVALVFVGKDEDTQKEIKLVMPKCKWQGEYTLDFNNDNPIELNYSFLCMNVTMPNGKVGAAWLDEDSTTAAEETPAQTQTPAGGSETPAQGG